MMIGQPGVSEGTDEDKKEPRSVESNFARQGRLFTRFQRRLMSDLFGFAQWEINGDPLKVLNPNLNPAGSLRSPRGSMMKKHRLAQAWKKRSFEAWEEAGSPRFREPVEITFTIYRGRKIDPDNALAGLKHLIDGLTTRRMGKEGLIPDDSSRWVSYAPIVFVTGKPYADENAKVLVSVSLKGKPDLE